MAKLANSKTATDDTPVAPKDLSGNVTAENEIDDTFRGPGRERAGDFNDFEEDVAVVGDGDKKSAPKPSQPKTKSSQKTKVGKSKKSTEETPVAPKDINGDVTVENEVDDDSPRTRRKRTGDFNDFEQEETVVAGVNEKSAPTPAQPKKKTKTTKVADKKTKASKEGEPSAVTEKPKPTKTAARKTQPSKKDGHPVVTEETHPGGDTVEAEPEAETVTQKKDVKKARRKAKVANEASEPAAKSADSIKEGKEAKGKETSQKEKKVAAKPKAQTVKPTAEKSVKEGPLEADSGKTDTATSPEKVPSQAKAIKEKSAPKKPKDTTEAEPKPKSRKPMPQAIEAKGDTADTKEKAPESSKRGKRKKKADAEDVDSAPMDDPNVPSESAMDQAPFKKLLKRERGKIPAVKASADAAEAERKALGASDAVKGSDKDGKASKAKESKSSAFKVTEAPKGKKRKDGPETAGTNAESGPSEKKPKKARKSMLDAASSAVGAFVDSGIEAAAQGINAVKDLASGLGNESIADNVTAVAESAVNEKAKKAKAVAKRERRKDRRSVSEKDTEGAAEVQPVTDKAGENDDEDEQEDEDNFEEGDQTLALIKGFESEGDEEVNDDEGFKEGMKVPQVPKNKDLTKKLKAAKDANEEEPGVIYVGRIPHGFFEPQMRSYFSQFGSILRLRLSRNRTTGASKHYAFIEFASSSVASIVAETMNNYLLFGHILKCKLVPKEQVHENLWKGANKRFKKVPWAKIEGRRLEVGVSKEQWKKRVETEKTRRAKKGDKLKEIGYEFEAPELKGVDDVKGKEVENKGIEGGAVVEEKTIVTTDGGGGSMVISEEVKTKVVKKGGKRKAADGDKAEVAAPKVAKRAKKAKNEA